MGGEKKTKERNGNCGFFLKLSWIVLLINNNKKRNEQRTRTINVIEKIFFVVS